MYAAILNDFLIDTALPTNLNGFYQLGSILAALFVAQLATGVFRAIFYTSSIDLAFASVEYIMRDVSAGWALRYLHANGASLIFTCLYIHVIRGVYYGSYQAPTALTWSIGVLIFLLAMGTAFIGYVLP